MSKKIKFHAKSDLAYKSLQPYKSAKNYVPDWYKKSDLWVGGRDISYSNEGYPYKALKHCVPFLDSLTTGYILELWQDIRVQKDHNNNIVINWFDTTFPPLEKRDSNVSPLVPAPKGCSPDQFVWHIPFGIETPPGYSVFYTHPLNRNDLPFVTMSAVIDTDSSMIPGGNVPVFFDKDFEGIIPVGTPIAQVIPFKREEWDSEVINDENNYKSKVFNISKHTSGAYRRFMWSKKRFD
jgi:hypothetical protein